MDLVRPPKPPRELKRLGILSGSFNPPTVAHLELARAALLRVDAVLLVLPRVFPHAKDFSDASLEQRIEMLLRLDERLGIGVADQGLFIEIARESRVLFGAIDLWFLCGADAAHRIVNWDYGAPEAFHGMLEEFGLLVARRREVYEPPPKMAHRIEMLPIDNLDEVSSTDVRERIRAGKDWHDLVPEEIRDQIAWIYS